MVWLSALLAVGTCRRRLHQLPQLTRHDCCCCHASLLSYLAWKHHRLLFLDYLSALFVLLYMAALLRRCISQPSTLWYLGYIAIKAAPHMPLVFGMRAAFLRCVQRSAWAADGCVGAVV